MYKIYKSISKTSLENIAYCQDLQTAYNHFIKLCKNNKKEQYYLYNNCTPLLHN